MFIYSCIICNINYLFLFFTALPSFIFRLRSISCSCLDMSGAFLQYRDLSVDSSLGLLI